ncbi:phosphate acyltransferase PlsX [Spiribacter vilamensis]|uniref:Phosphate acyltransferase n=1 Tax=Spiribacter vilamensis TaxID=531306 RepID=A0A4V2GJ14_9GAMM|nr:phosphate acyltransferase PlsX [Spiribacter vilamensis]RZU98525.1 phosphate:acyl-[acyl carrier protein] acyltransferase [Spiribacter vilamensis]TVO60613.1 phosphate acyltransferase PlsX [Spiribacter vilamensis]
MAQSCTLAIDAMGGDHGPSVTVQAAAAAIGRHPSLTLILVGDRDRLERQIEPLDPPVRARLRIHAASQVVDMNESPSQALRFKRDSSMRVAIDLVRSGEADACVSAGNTGALMATARYRLKTLPGIDRPAICTTIPCRGGRFRMLDLGANVDCTAEHLFQFAVMGSVLVEALGDSNHPRIGLLNLGEEEIKGNDQVKHAAQLLQDSDLRYIGYVEGDSMFRNVADLVVCDGFTGNVALKSSEGVAAMISQYLRDEFRRNLFTRLAGLVAMPVLRALRRRLDHRQYNGASLLGLRGVVVKSHGSADAWAFEQAIETGFVEAVEAIPRRIDARLSEIFHAEPEQ